MKTYEGALMVLVTAWLLGSTTSAHAIALDQPVDGSDSITLMSPDGSSVAIQSSLPPSEQPNHLGPFAESLPGSVGMRPATAAPLGYPLHLNSQLSERFSLTPSEKLPIPLAPHTSLRQPKFAAKGQVTFQPIPTHWDAKVIPIPTQWDAEMFLIALVAGANSSDVGARTADFLPINDKKD